MNIAIIGNADPAAPAEMFQMAREIGVALATLGHTVLTGACSGLPYAAEEAALEANGQSLGFSPCASADEHENFMQPYFPARGEKATNYTGAGMLGRINLMLVEADVVVALGSGIGTLTEIVSTVYLDKTAYVLSNCGGACAEIEAGLIARVAGKKAHLAKVFSTAQDLAEQLK